jgi:hypothetical protein
MGRRIKLLDVVALTIVRFDKILVLFRRIK